MSSSILTTVQTQVNLYGNSISMILGNIGNVFIVILFNRHRNSACSIYLISGAIANNIYLLFLGFVGLFPLNYNNGTTFAFALCKLRPYIATVVGQVGKTMLVLACIDRYLITSDRATFRAFSTPKRAKYFVFFSIIVWSLSAIHVPIMETIINGQCGAFGIYSSIFTFYVLIFVGLMPPVVSGILGYLTYRNMQKLRNRVQPIAQNTNVPNTSLRQRDRDLMVIVISEVIVYIITSIPFPVISLEVTISNYIILNKSVQYHQIEGFMYTIAYLLLFINSAASFYTYLISSKPFRQDFKQLIINTYQRIRGNQVNLPTRGTNQANTQADTRV
jgi:hypothetical protein